MKAGSVTIKKIFVLNSRAQFFGKRTANLLTLKRMPWIHAE